jgi:HEAT repeat protein
MAQRTSGAAKRQTVNGRIELLRQTADSDRKLKEAAPLVEPLLYGNNQNVRYYSAECIGILQRGRKSSPPGLRGLLRDTSALVRVQAVETLGLLEDQGALPGIARLLSDKDHLVRLYATSAVGTLGGFVYLKNIRRGLIREKDELWPA